MLQASDIRFRYESRGPFVLNGVSLGIRPGETVGLRGRSGGGKTTLARILAGYLQPVSGQVLLDGTKMSGVGACPVQLIFQHPELTINPQFRISKALSEASDDWALLAEPLGIEPDWLSRFPHELSGGELQRIALARALGPHTRYLIADETTAMLDAITQAAMWRILMRAVRDRGVGLLAISHDALLLKRVADRIVVLDEVGQVQLEDERDGR